MLNKNNFIDHKLFIELIARTRAAAAAFIVAAIVLISFPLVKNEIGINYFFYMFCLILTIPTNIIRILIGKKIEKNSDNQINDESLRSIHNLAIFLNAFSFSLFLIISIWHIPLNSLQLVIPILILCAINAGAVTSLSLIPSFFYFFNFLTFFLPVITLFIKGYANQSQSYYLLSALLIGFYLFLFISGKMFYKSTKDMFTFEFDLGEERRILQKKVLELSEAQIEITNQKARADHATRLAAIGEMSKGIAHEINNPLAVIQGNVRQIQLFTEEMKSDERLFLNERTEKISSSINRIVKIINGLKLFTKQQEYSDEFLEEITINEVIDSSLFLCGEKFVINNIQLELATPKNALVHINRNQLIQVFFQLLNNAYDACIGVVDAKVTIQSVLTDKFVKVSISDNGSGILPTDRNLIFLPFYTTKEIGQGSGLGLSISKGIIENFGGQLVLEEDTKQTTFSFTIPLAEIV